MDLKVGDKAPEFTLPDQENTEQSLLDYRGQWVLLYFYPKDDTPGCTLEAQLMTKNKEAFADKNAVILGVSADSVKSHKHFADKHGINFPILADEAKKVIENYGVWQAKKLFGKSFEGIQRMSYLIDPEGIIRVIYPSVKPPKHSKEVLEDLKQQS